MFEKLNVGEMKFVIMLMLMVVVMKVRLLSSIMNGVLIFLMVVIGLVSSLLNIGMVVVV